MKCEERLDFIRDVMGIVKTPTIKEICEMYSSTVSGTALIETIQEALPNIFDFDFPIADENHRQELETKIVKNYYFRQICCESVEEWKLRLSNKLNLIMPYYNELYKSNSYLVNILDDVDYERIVSENTNRNGTENTKTNQSVSGEYSDSVTDNGSTHSKVTAKDINRASVTPQGSLSSIEDNTYLTNANIEDAQNESDNISTNNRNSDGSSSNQSESSVDSINTDVGKRDMVEKVKGKMGSKSKAEVVTEYRKAILNIDMEIVARLSDLFMNVYNAWE